MSYTKEQLRDIFRKPFNAEVWKNILLDFFHAKEIRTTPQDLELENTSDKGFYLGKNTTSEGLALGFFLFEINSGDVLRKRVGLRNMVKPFLKYDVDAAIAVFNDNKHWRLSFITDFGSTKTAPKRFTYVFGDSAQYYNTPVKRLFDLQSKDISVKNLYDTFSVEALTKEFYNELFEWYKWVAIDRQVDITFPNDLATTDDDREIGTHITRLVTRIMFVWFIKQMKLVPDSLFDAKEVNKLLQDFDALSETNGNYYNAILQNLFFATLNQEIPKRKFAEYQKGNNNYGDKNFYRDNKEKSWFKVSHDDVIAMFSQVPFLNGGLFECLDKTDRDNKAKVYYYDGFSREPSRQAHIPNCVFFDNEKGLLPIFNRYQFTIEENTPCEQQVALDPELLGKVFENLLGYINPETNESARNSSGSFYTPREIVNYMVGESVVAYLREKVDGDIEESIRQLANYTIETVDFTKEQRQQITEAIFHCRILDPACGSGAFPMGMLQMLVHILSVVDPDNTYWQEIVKKNAIDASTSTYQSNFSDKERKQRLQEIEDTFTKQINYPDYTRKLYLIEQCIYGVDIQPIALQISKLRFFISLVIEQQTNGNKGDNYGIQPLPNLSTKFVCANTLLKPEVNKYGNILNFDKELKDLQDKLLAIRQKYFYAKRADKKKLAQDDYAICKQIGLLIETNIIKPDTEKIASMEQKIKECLAEIKKYTKECWVDEEVHIGATLFEEGSSEIRHYDANKVKRDELTKKIKACEKEIKTENSKQKPQGFDAAVQQLIDWDPYDVNVTSPFFSPEWMFAIDNGFDIVIGNPPYIQLQNNGGALGELYAPCGFDTFARIGDIYSLFYERGHQLLKAQGHLCFITSNKWMRAGYGEKTRQFFVEKCNPLLLIDFAGVKVFESATVDTNILLFSKAPYNGKTISTVTKGADKNSLQNLSVFVQQNHTECKFTADSWVILSPIEQSIKNKIESVGTPLKDWDINIYRGVLTGCNEAFIISTEKRDEILSNCQSDDERKRTAELIRPILRGRDIKRYGYDWANLWLIYIPWHFPYQFDETIQGASDKAEQAFKKQYPAVYSHMLQFKEPLSKRNKAETGIRYEWYAMQRWGAKYWEDFNKPKICYSEIVQSPQFYFDEKEHFMPEATTFIMTGENLSYLCALFNSSTIAYIFKRFYAGGGLGENGYRYKKAFFVNLPIPKYVGNSLQNDIMQCSETDRIIYKLYGLSNEEICFIESQQNQ